MGLLTFDPIDLTSANAVAFRRAMLMESKADREPKKYYIDRPLLDLMDRNVDPRERSDVVNMGINLVAIMNGWI